MRLQIALAVLLLPVGFAATAPAQDEGKITRERWRAMYQAGTQIAYVHETVRSRVVDGHDVVVTENVVVLGVPVPGRAGRGQVPGAARSTITQRTEETPTGELVTFLYDNQNPKPLPSKRVTGQVKDGKLIIETAGRKPASREVPWDIAVKGPGFADAQLLKNPLKGGETRTITTFDPRTAQIDIVRLAAGQVETVLLQDGNEKKLLHVVVTHSISPDIEFHEFLDEMGESWKTTIPSQDMVVHTVPKEVATKNFP